MPDFIQTNTVKNTVNDSKYFLVLCFKHFLIICLKYYIFFPAVVLFAATSLHSSSQEDKQKRQIQWAQPAYGSTGGEEVGRAEDSGPFSRFYLSPLRTWALACHTCTSAHTRTLVASQTGRRRNSCLWQDAYFIQQTAGFSGEGALQSHMYTHTSTRNLGQNFATQCRNVLCVTVSGRLVEGWKKKKKLKCIYSNLFYLFLYYLI